MGGKERSPISEPEFSVRKSWDPEETGESSAANNDRKPGQNMAAQTLTVGVSTSGCFIHRYPS